MPEPQHITIDSLRTEIRAANGELELRLRAYIDATVASVRTQQDLFARGEFTQAQKAALLVTMDEHLERKTTLGISKRQFRIAVFGVALSFISVVAGASIAVVTILNAAHHG